jgi:hypothetical protein
MPQPAKAHGITDVGKGGPTLTEPTAETGGQLLRYGLGFVLQVGPRKAAVLANVRTVGKGHWDFEDGTDAVVFDDLATVGQQKAVVCARNAEQINADTGRKRVAVTYPIVGGFVPLAAKRADGTTHPAAGTGFGFSQALCFDLNDEGFFRWNDPSTQQWYVHQFAYDGAEFRVTGVETKEADAPLRTADGVWAFTAPGISSAIPDGDDLLYAANAKDATQEVTGVSRWRFADGLWSPIAFYPVTPGSEPSLIREPDGSLLFSARFGYEDGQSVKVFRSADGGREWDQVLHALNLRANAPVVLNQAADGTPYIAANHPDSFRAKMCLWPLNAGRDGVEPPVVARDCVADFGPAPEGTTWFADHPSAATVQLADGEWHNLLAYRVMAFSTAGVGGETPTAHTGCYIVEVHSAGPPRPAWAF